MIGGFFGLILSCDTGFKASKLIESYVTFSPLIPINRANMGNYSLNGTCFYNGQPVTINIKGQIGDPTLSPKLSTCANQKWAVNELDLSDLSQGNVTIEAIHLNPKGKGYAAQAVVIKVQREQL